MTGLTINHSCVLFHLKNGGDSSHNSPHEDRKHAELAKSCLSPLTTMYESSRPSCPSFILKEQRRQMGDKLFMGITSIDLIVSRTVKSPHIDPVFLVLSGSPFPPYHTQTSSLSKHDPVQQIIFGENLAILLRDR
ncbi:hypothetical protein RRG08_010636 [Elysia crispata]|uniref:Uncharacterized protein n=1 Tax=Elysia crispata TaxID=231223 RepID=A0AAE0XPS3_9GAST|nr:hypothetical protein RRG08_010636 [Elysia crispata]